MIGKRIAHYEHLEATLCWEAIEMPGANRKHKLWIVAVISMTLLMLILETSGVENNRSIDSTSTDKYSGLEKVFSLPIGSGKNEIGIEDTPQSVAWGPSSFAIDNDGVIYIVDGVNSRIVVVNRDGAVRSRIKLSEPIVSPVDIRVVDNRLFLLDLPSAPPKIHEINTDGKILRSWEIAKEYVDENISGFNVGRDKNGDISIDLEFDMAWSTPFVVKNNIVSKTILPKMTVNNHAELQRDKAVTFALKTPRSKSRFLVEKDWNKRNTGKITIFNEKNNYSIIAIKTDRILSTLSFVDCDKQGNIFLYTEESGNKEENILRAFLRKIGLGGRQVGAIEVPVGDFYTYPDHGIRICERGDAYIMVPDREKVTFYKSRINKNYIDTT
jgi:hypothetical protein